MASYSGQQFTIAKQAKNICINRSSKLLSLKTCAMPHMNETKLIIAAVVSGDNRGDATANSKIPWLYHLLCSSSTTLLVTLNPNVEMPMKFSKYSANPKMKLESPLIVQIL